jgi:hypothetical protein
MRGAKFNILLGQREISIIRAELCRDNVVGRGQAGSPGSGGASRYLRRGFPRATHDRRIFSVTFSSIPRLQLLN